MPTDAAKEAKALRAFLVSRGFKPSGRAVISTLRELGLKFRDSEVRDAAGTQPGRKIRAHGTQSGRNADASSRESAHVAKGVVIDSGDHQDRELSPQPPLLAEMGLPETVGGVDASPVPVIPPKLTISAQDPNTDFAPFAQDVAVLIAVDRTRHPRKANWSEKWLRQSLALWRIKHGDDAFARGIEIGISSGNGCDYARGVMERFNPDRDLRAIDGGRYPYKPGHPLYDQNLDPDFDPDQGFEYTPEAEIHRSPQDIALLQRAGIAL